jgi:hypothetical protein
MFNGGKPGVAQWIDGDVDQFHAGSAEQRGCVEVAPIFFEPFKNHLRYV